MTHAIDQPPRAHRGIHVASAMLLLATVFWGCGFTWAKAGGDAINRLSDAGAGSAIGPTLLLAWRFVAGGILCLLFIPSARRGWNPRDAGRAIAVGLLLGTGVVLQHLGLDRTSEAVSAFLTNLTILFVPLIATIGLRRAPPMITWIGVALATLGIWLMTGATPAGFGWGELLGLGCSIVFSFYIISLNVTVTPANVWRMTAGQFVVAGLVSAAVCFASSQGVRAMAPASQLAIFIDHEIWWRFALLTSLTTVLAFGLMNYFQPRIEPTHAALIYLMEPVIAALFARLAVGRSLPMIAWLGAALILAANIVVEVVHPKRRSPPLFGVAPADR